MLTTKDILNMLKMYRDNTRVIRQLEFELGQIEKHITDEDTIYALALSAPDGEMSSGGHISDRTAAVALRYHDDAVSQRAQLREGLLKALSARRAEKDRADFYVSLLEDDLKVVITQLYMEGQQADILAQELGVSSKTVTIRRNKALAELLEMYNRIAVLYQ